MKKLEIKLKILTILILKKTENEEKIK